MVIDEFGDVERVLVVAPHPDDAEIGCGGTVALLAREGVEVHYLIATVFIFIAIIGSRAW